MAEYIEKKKLIEFACRHIDGKVDANDIARFPTADVVPVVRCKDCKYLSDLRCENPNNADGKIYFNHYCSYGERRCD